MAEFTHFKKDGSAVMVDVHEKPDTYRAASATGTIQVSPEVFAAVRDHTAKKGDVLGVARLAGIPPFAGFFSKFFVFAAAFKGGFHLLVFIALVNTVVSLYYYLLVVKAM